MRKIIMLAVLLLAASVFAQSHENASWGHAQNVAGTMSGVVLLECPFLEHPEYGSDATCIETHAPPHEVRAGIDRALAPLFERAVEGHTEAFAARLRSGWTQMGSGYLMRGWPLEADTAGPWLRVEVHDLGETRLVTLYVLH